MTRSRTGPRAPLLALALLLPAGAAAAQPPEINVIVGSTGGGAFPSPFALRVQGPFAPSDVVELRFFDSPAIPYDSQPENARVSTAVRCDGGTRTIRWVLQEAASEIHVAPAFGGFDHEGRQVLFVNGNPQGPYDARSPDIDADGEAGLADLDVFRAAFFRAPLTRETDLNRSGRTDLADLEIFRTDFFSGARRSPCP